MPETTDPRSTGARVDSLLGELTREADPVVARHAEELVRLLTQLYGAGLERIVDTLRAAYGHDTLVRLCEDDLVASLLVLHDLHPKDTGTRVQEALDRVRPYLGSHAGGVELLGVDENGVAYLRLEGNCDGCPSSTETVRYAIEGSVAETAPEVTRVEVEGMVADVADVGQEHRGTASNVIPVGALFRECPVPEVEARA